MSFQNKKIYVAGHRGLIGSAFIRYFSKSDSVKLVVASHSELELTDQKSVADFINYHSPDIVIVAAGKVGGILTNSKYPAEFAYQNLMIEANIIHSSWKAGVMRLLNFGSACIYPKICSQPMVPDLLMTGKMEETNEPYGIAKIAGLSLCASYNRQCGTSYINAIPSNVYGPGDNFDLEKCHVIAALIRRFHEAKKKRVEKVILWGSGEAKRDFLYVDDLVKACILLLHVYREEPPINVGIQAPCTIKNLAGLVAEMIGFQGQIIWDTSRPDGAPERVLDATEIKKLGFIPQTDLRTGLKKTYEWFLTEGVL